MEQAKPVRVLNLFTIMNRGGAETMVMNYYRHIDREQVQFDFVVHREEEGAYEAEIRELGGRIYHMPPVRPWAAKQYKEMFRSFLIEHPEYQILHSHMSELGCYAFEVAKDLNRLVRICHAHNRPYGIDMKSPIRWYYKHRIRNYATDYFICGQEAGIWLYGKQNIDKCYMMNNAIDAKAFSYNIEIRKQLRNELGLDCNFVIGHVGRFNKQKNHMFLLEVFAELVNIRSDARLVLVGGGDLAEVIHKKACDLNVDDKVIFLGIRTDIENLLQAFDLFLFPSLFEGLSVALIEAQAAGLQCIISDTIPIECKKTDLVHSLSLKVDARIWAEEAAKYSAYKRCDTFSAISDASFDINKNAIKIQNFYLQKVGQ